MAIDLTAVADDHLPVRLASLHASLETGDQRRVRLPASITGQPRTDLLVGAGFREISRDGTIQREWTLPDTVGPNLAVLIVGLNPSPASADSGIGFARPGNRFWPALLAAGVVTTDRDPHAALRDHGMGMTDVVKRTTRRASELDPDEYRSGMERLHRMAVRWEPQALAFVGLAGWRVAVDRRATAGWQQNEVGGRPVYLLPSTSGLNASSQLPDFIEHFEAISAGVSS